MEARAILSRDEVPHELCLAVQVACLIKQSRIGIGIRRREFDGGYPGPEPDHLRRPTAR